MRSFLCACALLLLAVGPTLAADEPPKMKFDEVKEVAPGVFVEFDPNGNPIGIEVISVRRRSGQMAPLQAAAK